MTISHRISRRQANTTILSLLGGAAALLACGEADEGERSSPSGGTSSGGTSGGTSSGGSEAGWASGGTKSMTASATYPDPFAAAPASSCVLIPTATEGPCTEAADRVRKDISEGYTGLPVRVSLRVVDGSCNPVSGATVKVWHTSIGGSYSGDTPNNGMCLKDQADAAKHYFRGTQTTDADGRVDFDTCFPGWYPGRTIHIHFTVASSGASYTSQLVFDDRLVTEIFATHPEYSPYGTPDTNNAADNVLARGSIENCTLKAERMSDGAMLASKQLVVSV